MTIYYVHDTGSDANPGTTDPGTLSDWTSAKATLAGALSAATVAGDQIIVSDDHLETPSGTTTLTANANHTVNNPIDIMVVTHADTSVIASPGQDRATGKGEIDGQTNNFTIVLRGYAYCYGMRLLNHGNVFFVDGNQWELEECLVAGDGGYMLCRNGAWRMQRGKLDFDTTSYLWMFGGMWMEFTSTEIDSANTGGLIQANNSGSTLRLISCDFSGMTSSIPLWQSGDTPSDAITVHIENPVMGASAPPLLGGTLGSPVENNWGIMMVGHDDNDSRALLESYSKHGSVVTTTATYRDGAKTYDGTNRLSFQITGDNVAFPGAVVRVPLCRIAEPGDLAAKTVTVHMLHDLGAGTPDDLQNIDIWLEGFVKASSGTTDRNKTGKPAPITTTGTDLTNNTEAWTESLTAGHEVKQEMTLTWAGGENTAGPLDLHVCLAKTMDGSGGGQLFVCPDPDIA